MSEDLAEKAPEVPEAPAEEPAKALEPEKPLSLLEKLSLARERRARAAQEVSLLDIELNQLERLARLEAHAAPTAEPAFLETVKGVIPNPKAKK